MSRRTDLEYAQLALEASDQAYFDNTVKNTKLHLANGTDLAPLADVPRDKNGNVKDEEYRSKVNPKLTNEKLYKNEAPFAVPAGFKVEDTIMRDNGAKAVIYRNANTNEIMVAFGGTDGVNALDHASNSQTYGFSQWDALDKVDKKTGDKGLLSKLDKLKETYGAGDIIFTGQSLGGALAQYATADYIKAHLQDDPSKLHLVTYNGLGGKDAIEKNIINDPHLKDRERQAIRDKLNHLGSATHYVVNNDLVSKLGGGHIGANGEVVMLDWKYLDGENKGKPMSVPDAHRIETAFYTHLSPDAHELQKGRVVKEDSPDFKLLHTPEATKWANAIASVDFEKNVTSANAWPKLIRGLAGGHFGAPDEVNKVVKEVLATERRAGMSDATYQLVNELNDIYNPPANTSMARKITNLPVKLPMDALTVAVVAETYPAEFYATSWNAASNAGNNLIKKHPDYMADKNIIPEKITPQIQPTARELEAAEVSRLIKAKISPDGKDALGVSTVPDAQGRSHHWSLSEDGSVKRIEIQRSQEGSRITLMDYPKNTKSPNQIHQTTVDIQGNIKEDRIIKLDAQGQWREQISHGKLLENSPSSTPINKNPNVKESPVQRISQVEPLFEAKQAIISPTNYGQLGASTASALKIAQDIPEQHRENVQQMVDTMIAKNNLSVDLNEKTHSATPSLA